MGSANLVTPADIRAARKRAGLTQTQAANLLGVTRVTWARWESGEQAPTVHQWRYWRHVAGIERIPFRRP